MIAFCLSGGRPATSIALDTDHRFASSATAAKEHDPMDPRGAFSATLTSSTMPSCTVIRA